MTENIVILGGSIVSVFNTSELRKDGYEAKITIVASEKRFPYDEPPLSKEWMQDNKDEKLPLLKPETFFDDNNILLILNTKITSIDTDKKQLFSEDDQTISYDKLVINFKKCFKRRLNMTFYDENGNAIAYTEDSVHLYLFTGKPVVYFVNKKVYGFNGAHLGWFEEKIFYYKVFKNNYK
ncbi:4-fold beta flower protein [Staphylococcus kloosii]|uniref:4-fold beta flower protein n=1 Tax=Staphylococcus kloosii TaxID=29384 RepID=UPI001304E7A8|nr:FAD-dependent oxidoreductase [Staphylococcus kloosii]MBF7022910.1 FAD-dependent oxidoreductase [Staphylococcus kloosii]MBF7028502.1 FAD-dependent oxidoreductase [Staphylococcus kloosii]